jgi:hypothetical protein
MEINWKDFGLMYVIVYVLNHFLILIQRFLFPTAVTIEMHFSFYLFTGILFAVPLAFYFRRNKSILPEALAISLIFSFTYPWILLQIIPILFSGAPAFSIITTYSALNMYLHHMIVDVIIGLISGLIAWFAINNFIEKSKSK